MPNTKRNDPAELISLAIAALDAQIAELQATRAQLAAMLDWSPAVPTAEAAAPQKRRKLSAAARSKISAAAKARWARERKAKAQKPKKTAKKTHSKTKPAKAKKAPVKKTEPKPSTPAAET